MDSFPLLTQIMASQPREGEGYFLVIQKYYMFLAKHNRSAITNLIVRSRYASVQMVTHRFSKRNEVIPNCVGTPSFFRAGDVCLPLAQKKILEKDC